MLFKGTARRSALAIAQEIDRVGGIINAFTEKETTCVYAIIPREHLRLAFDVLTDMTVGSLLDETELEKEKDVIVNEIRSVDDSPEEKGHDRYLTEMCGDHPLALKITGEVDEVRGVAREDLQRFYRERFVPVQHDHRGCRQFPAGGGQGPCAVPLHGRDTRGGASPQPPRTAPSWKQKVAVVPDRFNQVQIYAGTCYPLDHEVDHYYTSLVFSTAFGESMSCRLFQKLREEQAFAIRSTLSARSSRIRACGPSTPTPLPRWRGSSSRRWTRSSTRLLKEPLSDAEIGDAQSHLVGSMILSREDMETRMKRLVRQHMMMDRILEFDESVAALRKVNAEAVEHYARQCLRKAAFSLLAYGSRGMSAMRGFNFTFPD